MPTLAEEAYSVATQREPATLAAELAELLGQRVTAYAVGLRDPRTIGRYARSEVDIDPSVAQRLVDLYAVLTILKRRLANTTARAWLLGSNPLLSGMTPIELLHASHAAEVVGAAESFIQAG